MYVCISIYLHRYIHTYTYELIYIYIYVCIYIYMYIQYIYTCVYVRVCFHVNQFIAIQFYQNTIFTPISIQVNIFSHEASTQTGQWYTLHLLQLAALDQQIHHACLLLHLAALQIDTEKCSTTKKTCRAAVTFFTSCFLFRPFHVVQVQ